MTVAQEKNPPVKLPNEPAITPQVVAEHGWRRTNTGRRALAHPERPITKTWLFPLWIALRWALLLSTSLTPSFPHRRPQGNTPAGSRRSSVRLIAINTLRTALAGRRA